MNNVSIIRSLHQNNTLKKVAGYARVSTADLHQDSSFKRQIDELKDLIHANQKYIFVGIFKDKKSGTSTKGRFEFNTMIDLAKAGEIDIIYTKSITRFGRNILDTISIVRMLKNINVEVIFQKENISSLDPQMEFVLQILAMQSEEESKNISDNTKWSINRKITNGENLTSHLYGYKIEGESWEIIESEAQVVRMIYDFYINNHSYKTICERLYRLKIKSPKGNERWHQGTLESMLQNEKFAGHMSLGKTYIFNGTTLRSKRINLDEHFIKNHHPAIIEPSVFNTAIRLREKRTRNDLKTYLPLLERMTPYYRFVYSIVNKRHLKYVLERPKGKYEIPTLYCYNKEMKNRVMVTVSNLFSIINDALLKLKTSSMNLSQTASDTIDLLITTCEISLHNAGDNSTEFLAKRLSLQKSKSMIRKLVKDVYSYKPLHDINDIRKIIDVVHINEDYSFSIKLKLIDFEEFYVNLLTSSIDLKVGSSIKTIYYSLHM